METTTTLTLNRKFPMPRLRVKSGCLTCRGRKKKCDEVKPLCSGCSRNKLICSWPPSIWKRVPNEDAAQHDRASEVAFVTDASAKTAVALNLSRHLTSRVSSKSGASNLTNESSLFLRHYTTQTGGILAVKESSKNPFLTHMLPLACSDDLLMHSILAIGGIHLLSRRSSLEVQRSSLMHFIAMIEGVREQTVRVKESDFSSTLRLLLILLMLCHYQIMEGADDGKFYEHLKACHTLIERLFVLNPSPGDVPSDKQDELGFCLELYAYIMISNHVSPFGTLVGAPLELNTTQLSHDHLSRYKTFGTMFADLYGLYQFMPQIARLASTRLAEEAAGLFAASDQSLQDYKVLETSIASWRPPLPRFDTDVQDWTEQSMTAEVIRRGLFIYLLTSMAGSLVDDFEMLQVIQTYTITMIRYMLRLVGSRYQTLFLWPALICGSCLTDRDLQNQLTEAIKDSPCQARHVHTVCNVLEMLWADADPRAFGPYGLYRLKKKGIWLPML